MLQLQLQDLPSDVLERVVGLSENGPAADCACRALRSASLGARHASLAVRGAWPEEARAWVRRRTVDRLTLALDGDGPARRFTRAALFAQLPPLEGVLEVDVRVAFRAVFVHAVSLLESLSAAFPRVRTLRLWVDCGGEDEAGAASSSSSSSSSGGGGSGSGSRYAPPRYPALLVVPPAPAFPELRELDVNLRGGAASGCWVEVIPGRRLPQLVALRTHVVDRIEV